MSCPDMNLSSLREMPFFRSGAEHVALRSVLEQALPGKITEAFLETALLCFATAESKLPHSAKDMPKITPINLLETKREGFSEKTYTRRFFPLENNKILAVLKKGEIFEATGGFKKMRTGLLITKTEGETPAFSLEKVAVGKTKKNKYNSETVHRENELYLSLKNHRIVHMSHCLRYEKPDKKKALFVQELCDRDLFNIIQPSPGEIFSLRQRFLWAIHILEGVAHIHENDMVHRDIKPENILVKGEKCLIGDLGSALSPSEWRALPPQQKPGHSSPKMKGMTAPPYLPPELLFYECYQKGEAYPVQDLKPEDLFSTKADIFALGITLTRLLFSRSHFPKHHPLFHPDCWSGDVKKGRVWRAIQSNQPLIHEEILNTPERSNAQKQILGILQRMTDYDPRKRTGAPEALAEFKEIQSQITEHTTPWVL